MSHISEMQTMLADHLSRLMRHRERYVKAWIASTGLRPEECELVEESRHTPNGFVTTVRMQRRQP